MGVNQRQAASSSIAQKRRSRRPPGDTSQGRCTGAARYVILVRRQQAFFRLFSLGRGRAGIWSGRPMQLHRAPFIEGRRKGRQVMQGSNLEGIKSKTKNDRIAVWHFGRKTND